MYSFSGRFLLLTLLIVISQGLSPTTSFAADEDKLIAATEAGTAGVRAYQAGDYETATESLEIAYQMIQAPSLALWSARALIKTGKWVQAAERLRDATQLEIGPQSNAGIQQKAQADAAAERDALLARIPRLTLQIESDNKEQVSVRLNGTPLKIDGTNQPILLDPGEAHIEGRRGEVLVTESVLLSEGDTKSVTLSFKTPPSQTASKPADAAGVPPEREAVSSPNWQTTSGWIGIGIGGAGARSGQ